MPFVEDQDPLIRTLKRVACHLKALEIPFALAGSLAVYARGGAPVDHDVDFLIKEEDADRVLAGLTEEGFRAVRPPEGWLVKVYEEDRLVDLIFRPVQRPVDDEHGVLRIVRPHIGEPEALGHLPVELDRPELPRAA